MTGCPKHIEVRVNPHYKYDEVLKTINDNFYCLNNQISGLTSGNTYISN